MNRKKSGYSKLNPADRIEKFLHWAEKLERSRMLKEYKINAGIGLGDGVSFIINDPDEEQLCYLLILLRHFYFDNNSPLMIEIVINQAINACGNVKFKEKLQKLRGKWRKLKLELEQKISLPHGEYYSIKNVFDDYLFGYYFHCDFERQEKIESIFKDYADFKGRKALGKLIFFGWILEVAKYVLELARIIKIGIIDGYFDFHQRSL